jgi:1,2-diacylglycerol 3-alpha-glucosyltransferase
MRIGLFTNNYRPLVNGLATSVDTFARAFRHAGHTVTIVAPRYVAGDPSDDDVLRVPGLRAPTHNAYVLPLPRWPGLKKAVRARGLDVYHAQHPYLLGAAAERWAREADRPLVFTYHTRYERYAHYIPGPTRLIARLAIQRACRFAELADLVIAPTHSVARELATRGVQTPVEVVPTGVSITPPSTDTARGACRAALGVGGGSPLCLSIGRLAREKNQAFLLHAFSRMIRELPAAQLVLVGDGDERTRLTCLADDLGIRPRVHFAGSIPHERIADYTSAADLFLFPSTSETQGLAALEALAGGLPVVAVTSEAAADLLTDESAGVLCPENPTAFAGCVLTLWANPERRRAMAAAARRVAAQYTPGATAARLLSLYQDLCGSRRSAAVPARPLDSREART